MPTPPGRRLTGKLRKDAIAQSVLPLFARKGLDGVTTNELAESCGVSEALIFQHFPSKVALFNEMLMRYADFTEPVRGEIFKLPAGAATLVELVFNFMHRIVIKESEKGHQVMRLFYRSFVDDGDFARAFLRGKMLGRIRICFENSLVEARKMGDALPLAASPHNLFWFVQHVASMGCMMRLPPKRPVKYRGTSDKAVAEMTLFALRGIGLTEASIGLYATPARFAAWRRRPTM